MIGKFTGQLGWSPLLVAVVLFFSAGALCGQSATVITAAEGACGPSVARFQVTVGPESASILPAAGKAIVYVLEMPSGPTLRVGMDGKWVGAEKGASYLTLSVLPGMHHLCVQQQSRLKVASRMVALNSLRAISGRSYYFVADTARPLGPALFRLDELNEDEGKELRAQWRPAVAHPLPLARK